MTVLFLTLGFDASPDGRSIYNGLADEFVKNGHSVYVACQAKNGGQTSLKEINGSFVLQISTGEITKCGSVRKGISTLLIPYYFKKAVKRYLKKIRFDLVLYSTPPVTFAKVVKTLKKRDGAAAYLMLKDIFPQNAVDLKMISGTGISRPLYMYFRRQEKALYRVSDHIGCMSQANMDYIIKNNPYLDPKKVEVCPNSISLRLSGERHGGDLRKEYNVPADSVLFLLGGNLGRPQDVDFLIRVLRSNRDLPDRFFVICGTGTEYPKLECFIKNENPGNVLLINGLPGKLYERLACACDTGIITLDHRFTVPNFPSRMLTYMECCLPVLAATDKSTDLKDVLARGKFGWWCGSDDEEKMKRLIDRICGDRDALKAFGANARAYLERHYTSDITYRVIMKHF